MTNNPVPYTEHTPPATSQPTATIDIIPPTPTTVVSEPPSFCTRCSCDIQKQGNQQIEDKSNSLGTTLTNKLTSLQTSTQPNISTTENLKPLVTANHSFIGTAPVVSSAASIKSSIVASTSTTQLHRSQLCSTEISASTCQVTKNPDSGSSPQAAQQAPVRENRPSTPHKPSNSKQPWKEQSTSRQSIRDNQSNSRSSFSAQHQPHKNNSADFKKQTNNPSTKLVGINSNVVNVTNVIPSSTTQERTVTKNVQSNFGPYPLKKHPLINIKTGNLLKIATSSIVAAKSKVNGNPCRLSIIFVTLYYLKVIYYILN